MQANTDYGSLVKDRYLTISTELINDVVKYFQPPGVRADPPDVRPHHSPHLRPGQVLPHAVGGAGLLQQRRHGAVQPVQLPQLLLVHPGSFHAAGLRRLP